MSSLRTRLERLEARVAEVHCVWMDAGWKDRGGLSAAGDGVSRVFVPVQPEALAPGLLAVLRHPDRDGAEVSAAAAAWALALSPRQRTLFARARSFVLITAGGPAAAGATSPEAAIGRRPPPRGCPRPRRRHSGRNGSPDEIHRRCGRAGGRPGARRGAARGGPDARRPLATPASTRRVRGCARATARGRRPTVTGLGAAVGRDGAPHGSSGAPGRGAGPARERRQGGAVGECLVASGPRASMRFPPIPSATETLLDSE